MKVHFKENWAWVLKVRKERYTDIIEFLPFSQWINLARVKKIVIRFEDIRTFIYSALITEFILISGEGAGSVKENLLHGFRYRNSNEFLLFYKCINNSGFLHSLLQFTSAMSAAKSAIVFYNIFRNVKQLSISVWF